MRKTLFFVVFMVIFSLSTTLPTSVAQNNHYQEVLTFGKYLLQWNSTATHIAVLFDDHDFLKIWNSETGKVEYTVERKYEALSFSPDGKTLAASASDNSLIELIDVASGKTLSTYFNTRARQMEWSPDGKFLEANWGAELTVFDVLSGKKVDSYWMPGSYLSYVKWFDKTIMVVDQYNCISSWRPNLYPSSANSDQSPQAKEIVCTFGDVVDYHPSHRFFAVNSNQFAPMETNNEVWLVDSDSLSVIGRLDHDAPTYWLSWSPNGEYLLSITVSTAAGDNTTLHIWHKAS